MLEKIEAAVAARRDPDLVLVCRTDGIVDFAGTCGNMSSAIGPFALDQGLLPLPAGAEAIVRIHDTNTGKIIVARFPAAHGKALVEGFFVLDGVAGSGAPIRLEFMDPAPRRRAAFCQPATRWTCCGSRMVMRFRQAWLMPPTHSFSLPPSLWV